VRLADDPQHRVAYIELREKTEAVET